MARIARGINLTVSPKRMLGVTKIKQDIARKTGIPTTRQGLERKIGRELMRGAGSLLK